MAADPFVVTSPTTAVTVGAPNRSARVTYTVTNISGRPLRARLRLVALEPTKAEWLRVDGEAERNFALGATENFTVILAIPADAPAGTYLLRADAVGEDQPDEVYTLGPAVAASVSGPVVKHRFPWWIAAAAAAVVVAAVVVFVVISHSGRSNAKIGPTTNVTPAASPGSSSILTGPGNCQAGDVPRSAFVGDLVCVPPRVRDETADDNAAAASRIDPQGANGPTSCKTGYVWREARPVPVDHVCVTPQVRAEVEVDNTAAAQGYTIVPITLKVVFKSFGDRSNNMPQSLLTAAVSDPKDGTFGYWRGPSNAFFAPGEYSLALGSIGNPGPAGTEYKLCVGTAYPTAFTFVLSVVDQTNTSKQLTLPTESGAKCITGAI